MNQININPAPAIPMRISKKTAEISWFSENVTRNTNSDNKNTELKKDFKKKK